MPLSSLFKTAGAGATFVNFQTAGAGAGATFVIFKTAGAGATFVTFQNTGAGAGANFVSFFPRETFTFSTRENFLKNHL